jgi:hypothetical protein
VENYTTNNTTKSPPPATSPLVLVRSKQAYQTWHSYHINLKIPDRATIGEKIDGEFLNLLEFIFRACFAYDKLEKLSFVSQANSKNDLIKFFLQITWEQKILDHKQYGDLIVLIEEVGRMLGGWKKDIRERM